MIIITGDVVCRPDSFDEALRLSEVHVARSRSEPGCLSHAVHRDVEDPLRLVFFEEWADMAAVQAHFVVPASKAFGRALVGLAARTPTIQLYDATRIER
jgi:quinol monooxygenase YgiN